MPILLAQIEWVDTNREELVPNMTHNYLDRDPKMTFNYCMRFSTEEQSVGSIAWDVIIRQMAFLSS